MGETVEAPEGLVAAAMIPGIGQMVQAFAAPGPAGGGGSFFVDPERAQECIRALRGVAKYLIAAEQSMELAFCPAPGSDVVSVNFAVQAGIMANRAAGYVAAWRMQLMQTADGLEQQLKSYRDVESANRALLT